MRLTHVLATTGLLTAGLLAGQHSASADPQSDLVVKEKVRQMTVHDLGRKGMSQGDTLAFRTEITAHGKRLGIGGGECVLVRGKTAAEALYHCEQTYRLTEGHIVAAGFLDYSRETNQWAIVGGTGRYAGTTGVLEFTEPTTNSFVDTFRFQ